MRNGIIILMYSLIMASLVSSVLGATIYVDDVTDPNEDGTAAHPFDTIQEGIDAAANGDTVLVLDGTYTGYGNRDINFHGKAITVTSEHGPSTTIIDVQGSSSDPHRGFYFNNGETSTSIIDGFTMQNGYRSSDHGGAIYLRNASPMIRNCIFSYNQANYGGAIYIRDTCSLNVSNCSFTSNTAHSHKGGAIRCYNHVTSVITDCSFSSNTAETEGGAIALYSSSLTCSNAQFTQNQSNTTRGGAIELLSNSEADFFNCAFITNTAEEYGGAVYADNSQLTVTNALFEDNTATTREGGAIRGQSITGETKNCNFINNSAPGSGTGRGGGVSLSSSSSYVIKYCIFWNNTAETGPDIYPTSGLSIYYCDVEHSYPGVGNISLDPLFVTGPYGSYYLSQIAAGQASDSPCMNAGYEQASNVCSTISPPSICMDNLTTRTDSVTDNNVVDIGLHYQPVPTATPTITPTPFETYTPTLTPTATNTYTPSPTPTCTATPTPTTSPEPTETPTITPTLIPMDCEWSELSSGGDLPGNRHFHRLAYDSSRAVIVLYGGNDNVTYHYELWEFDGTTWNEIIPTDSPAGRDSPGWVYLKNIQMFFMFGGWNINNLYLCDGWLYDPATTVWMEVEDDIGCFPEPRQGHGMVYDPNTGKVIMFGGLGFHNMYFNDTWLFDPTIDPTTECPWTDVSPTVSPPARAFHGMCFMDRMNRVVMFGGDSSEGRFNDTWIYYPNSNQWVQITPTTHPEYLQDMGMSYDSLRNRVLLYGGNVPDTRLEKQEKYSVDQTWMFNPVINEWTSLDSSVFPPARGQTSMAYNVAWAAHVLYGGRSDYQWETDTWQYRICYTPTPTPTPKPLPAMKDNGKILLILLFTFFLIGTSIRKLY